MAFIALITDFGNRDEYVGLVKGVILEVNPQAQIIDLSHEIPPQDLIWASFLLGNAYKFFPRKTIFLCVVDPEVGTERRTIIVKTKDYFFVCPDNGILTKVLEREKVEQIVEIRNKKFFLKEISSTFHGRDIMAPVAGYLSKGVALEKFGPKIKNIRRIKLPTPIMRKDCMIGKVIHIDHFGNLVTNIEKESLRNKVQASFSIAIKGRKIHKINNAYAESNKRRLLAIWGSRNLLEISINLGNAAKKLMAGKGEKVIIYFY
ncbi:MAG: SAM-dependent chlorinase/fluorinase [Candidatus Omnitrophica bacterium]|nr:SAM-dependent chlorinase/fluorinase [Candidatus Omnitrophota bacterium]